MKKDIVISFKISSDEFLTIKREASFSKKSVSKYIREKVFDCV